MDRKVDLYGAYSHFDDETLARVRRKTFVEDFGQNSWTTAEEYRRWVEWLGLDERSNVLEVASGSGGPALFLASVSGARVTGVDIDPGGVATATRTAQARGLSDRVSFREADAGAPLPFPDDSFDALLCVDSANHFARRLQVFEEWHRVLRPGGKALFTDPVVVTGLVSSHEIAVRSSVGEFVYTPPGVNERLVQDAGLHLVRKEDGSENAAAIAKRWHDARTEEAESLVRIEGEERFAGLQRFFAMVHLLASERRLSRILYVAQKPLPA